jgi:hypothetical protein
VLIETNRAQRASARHRCRTGSGYSVSTERRCGVDVPEVEPGTNFHESEETACSCRASPRAVAAACARRRATASARMEACEERTSDDLRASTDAAQCSCRGAVVSAVGWCAATEPKGEGPCGQEESPTGSSWVPATRLPWGCSLGSADSGVPERRSGAGAARAPRERRARPAEADPNAGRAPSRSLRTRRSQAGAVSSR